MYKESELAIVVPTKNRPQQVKNMLTSLERQTKLPGLIVIMDSGGESNEVVSKFIDRLPIVYENTNIVGQIAQRNAGIGMVNDQYSLVCNLDDDIVLENDAVQKMINFWNQKEPETAGISFTITNSPKYKNGLLRKIGIMGSNQSGKILVSGYNVPVSEKNENVKSDWLCGGATVWRHSVIKEFTHKPIKSKWAVCEDIILSYPVSKKYPLYVCQKAKVLHDDNAQEKYLDTINIYRGKNAVLWRMYFVCQHRELSLIAFSWMQICQITSRLTGGAIMLRPNLVLYAVGQVFGLLAGLGTLVLGRDLQSTINE